MSRRRKLLMRAVRKHERKKRPNFDWWDVRISFYADGKRVQMQLTDCMYVSWDQQ